MLTLEVVDVPSATLSLGHLGPSSGAAELCFHSISQGPLVETRSPLWIWKGQRDTRREAASMGLEAGELPDSPVPGPRRRGREHCLLGQPEHIPSPGRSQRWRWAVLLYFGGCYDSQEFANQTRPKEEFCPWPQKLVVPRGSACGSCCPLQHLPDVRISKRRIWRHPNRRAISRLAKAVLERI